VKYIPTTLAIVCVAVGLVNFVVTTGGADHSWSPSLLFTHPLAIAGIGYLLFRHISPRFLYRAPREQRIATVQAIEHSGPPLTTIACGGTIGSVNFSGPLLRATVFPGGLRIKPIFLAAFAVAGSEITAIAFKREWGLSSVEIVHVSAEVASPIQLQCAKNDPFIAALQSILA